MSVRHSRAWWLGWPATSLYAGILHPLAGLICFAFGALVTWRLH